MEESAERREEPDSTTTLPEETVEYDSRAKSKSGSGTDDDKYYPVHGTSYPPSPVESSLNASPSSSVDYHALPSIAPYPFNSFSTLKQHRCLGNIMLLDTIKVCVSKLLGVVIIDQMKENCKGCQIDQTNHQCLYPLPRYYVYSHFNELIERLWTDRFISGIMRLLETQGFDVIPSRVQGMCEAFIHELMDVDDIPQRIKETVNFYHVLGGNSKILLNNLVTFWSDFPTVEPSTEL